MKQEKHFKRFKAAVIPFRNKLERLSLSVTFILVKYLQAMLGAYP